MAKELKLPHFTFPVRLWAEKLEIVLVSSKIDLKLEENINIIKTKIFCALPHNVLKLAPKETNISELIAWLKKHDVDRTTIVNVLAQTFPNDERPSVIYEKLQESIRNCMPIMNEQAVRVMAWSRLAELLPNELNNSILLLNKCEEPPAGTVEQLDRAFADVKGKSYTVAGVSERRQDGDEAINALRKEVEDLKILIKTNFENNNTIPGCTYCNKKGHTTSSCYSRQNASRYANNKNFTFCNICNMSNHTTEQCRKRSSNINSRNQETSASGWCYFHRRFGRNSTRCTQPCTYLK